LIDPIIALSFKIRNHTSFVLLVKKFLNYVTLNDLEALNLEWKLLSEYKKKLSHFEEPEPFWK